MSDLGDGYFKVYEEYSKTLRTWFVAYGIAAPAFLLSSDSLRTAITNAGVARSIGALFLVGVGLQVVLAAINKAAMWLLYYYEDVRPCDADDRPWYGKVACWI